MKFNDSLFNIWPSYIVVKGNVVPIKTTIFWAPTCLATENILGVGSSLSMTLTDGASISKIPAIPSMLEANIHPLGLDLGPHNQPSISISTSSLSSPPVNSSFSSLFLRDISKRVNTSFSF